MSTNYYHYLNKSTSNQKYSFSRQKRFNDLKTLQNTSTFYDAPSTKDKRATSLGLGNKSDLFNKSNIQTPGPQKYTIQDQITVNLARKRGCSFGLGRDVVDFGSFINKHTMKIGQPAPNNYNIKYIKNKDISYSLRAKTPTSDCKHTYKETPGPGNYIDILSLSQVGRYPISTFKSSGAATFYSQTKSKHKINELDNTKLFPGPGRYQVLNSITPNGKYTSSKMKSSKVFSFPHDKRSDVRLNSFYVPGPGKYQIPSEFGK